MRTVDGSQSYTAEMVSDVVIVDHHDSYTWNLVHMVATVTGDLPIVVQHDEAAAADVLKHDYVVLSPGPGHPAVAADFAIGTEVLATAKQPVLGVCLGMQGIVTTFGGRVERVPPAHGEVAHVSHDGRGLFAAVPQEFQVVRYHSLAVIEVPDCLEVTATSGDGVVMGVRHRDLPIEGVQFHPESILSHHGVQLVRNFLGAGMTSANPHLLADAGL